MKVFAISDTHFGHANVIDYCNRPFSSVEEMDETLIENWNSTVNKNDVVIHLGDFGLGNKDYIKSIIERLNGKKILILGNHDWKEDFYKESGFHTVSRFPIVYDHFYLMSHAPLILGDKLPYFNCYGHVHNDERYVDTTNTKCFCVERIGYRPCLLYEKR